MDASPNPRASKYKAIRKEDGEWIYGSYVEISKEAILATFNPLGFDYKPIYGIINELTIDRVEEGYADAGELIYHFGFEEIFPDTLCQFTGLKDKYGIDIYENDIVLAWSQGYNHKGHIKFRIDGLPGYIIYPAFANKEFWILHGQDGFDESVEVIGNICDNKKLVTHHK